MKNNKVKKMLCGLCSIILLGGSCQAVPVMADMGNGNFVAVNDSVAVDSITVNGITVEALYRPYDSSCDTDATYCCAALVKRFYEQVYGKNVYGLERIDSVPLMDGGQFVQTYEPKGGDILRDNYSVHWAIVKEVSGSTITLIQQNAWNTAYTNAWVGATVEKGDPRYTFFTWDGNAGEVQSAPTASFTVNYEAPQIYNTTAVVSAKIDNPYRNTVYQVGCHIWDAEDNLIIRHVEDCVRNESRFNMWYDIQGEIGLALNPGTAYKYQFFIIYEGQEYPGEIQSFTTAG